MWFAVGLAVRFQGFRWQSVAGANCTMRAPRARFHARQWFRTSDLHLRNVLVAWAKSELVRDGPGSITFKVADLGLAKLAHEMDAQNTVLADWIRAPEAHDVAEYGPMDTRMD